MKAQNIYHKMRAIAEDYHAYTDQLTAIAKWIEVEFEYKPQKLANDANTSEGQLTIPDVINRRELLIDFCQSMQCHLIATEQNKIENGVDDYLKSINSL